MQVLVPLLLEALYKYNLLATFASVVKGFCNTSSAIAHLGDKEKITSLSLRSLCKTVLGDTSLPTASALERSEVLVQIMVSITGGQAGEGEVVADKIVKFSSTVASEEQELKSLKHVLGTQVSCKNTQQRSVINHPFCPAGNSQANLRVSAEAEAAGEKPRHQSQAEGGRGRPRLRGLGGRRQGQVSQEDPGGHGGRGGRYRGDCQADRGPLLPR